MGSGGRLRTARSARGHHPPPFSLRHAQAGRRPPGGAGHAWDRPPLRHLWRRRSGAEGLGGGEASSSLSQLSPPALPAPLGSAASHGAEGGREGGGGAAPQPSPLVRLPPASALNSGGAGAGGQGGSRGSCPRRKAAGKRQQRSRGASLPLMPLRDRCTPARRPRLREDAALPPRRNFLGIVPGCR